VLVKRCKISGSHSQCEKDSNLVGCYDMNKREWFTLKMKVVQSFKTLGGIYQMTQRAMNSAVSLYTHLPCSYHSSACLTGIYQLLFVF